MKRLRIVAPLLVVVLLLTACQPAPTQLPPTAAPTTAPTSAPTALPATLAPAVPATAVPPTAVPTQPPVATATAAATATTAPAASPTAGGNAPVKATEFQLRPSGLAFDAAGNLYIGHCNVETLQTLQAALFKVDSAGMMSDVADADRIFGYSGDGGPALAAHIGCPTGFQFDPAGNLLFADGLGQRIRRIDSAGRIDSIVGSGEFVTTTADPIPHFEGAFSGDGGPASAAQLSAPNDLVFDADGNLYFADTLNARIRKVDTKGIISTIAGNGERFFAGDGGQATAASFNNTYGINLAIDAEGNLYVSETFSARVRKIDRQGIITTIAGTGEQGVSGDGGPATEAKINSPGGLAFDSEGNLYISSNAATGLDVRIRKVDKNGMISTFAGTGQTGFSGDGAAATAATFTNPWKLLFDSTGNLYLIDDVRVRKIDTKGIITTVAGSGS